MSSVTSYALKENHPLMVSVSGDGPTRQFKLSVREYRAKIRKYCAYFNTIAVSKVYDEYEETVKLANGIVFNACLY